MRRDEIISELRSRAGAIRAFGVTALYLYGSAARDEVNASSDIDLFADVDYDRFGFVPFMDLREFLKRSLGRKVDFTTRNALHPDLKDRIVHSAVKVFDDATVDTVAASGYRATSPSHSSSLITLTPSSLALPSFEPAPGPATT
jgi:uncharacterized protein